MDRWESQYQFWASFGVPAYEENSVPDEAEVSYPYITFPRVLGGFGGRTNVTPSIYDKSFSWERADALANAVYNALENGGALKYHVTCLLDEFANQKIPNFQHLISVIRSREISAHIVVQTQSQLKSLYKDNAETIIGNCSCVLFLGGSSPPLPAFLVISWVPRLADSRFLRTPAIPTLAMAWTTFPRTRGSSNAFPVLTLRFPGRF